MVVHPGVAVRTAGGGASRLEKALAQRGSLARWLEFVGGSEFSQLAPLLRGMQLVELMRIPASGLARLGMVPATARRLADELNKLKAVLRDGVRMRASDSLAPNAISGLLVNAFCRLWLSMSRPKNCVYRPYSSLLARRMNSNPMAKFNADSRAWSIIPASAFDSRTLR